MTSFKIFTAALLVANAVAISPSIAQNYGGGRGMGGGRAPSAGVSAGAAAGATAGGRMSAGTATPNINAEANMRTSQMTAPPAGATGGTTWSGANWNVAGNNRNGNWTGRDWHRRFNGAPGFAFGLGVGPGYCGGPYYDDYAYAGYPDDSYAYYNDPYYSDAFAYDAGPAVGVTVNAGADPDYCAPRYRSYDPASGTFLSYDGIRHPCP
jgi:hypothetical protein